MSTFLIKKEILLATYRCWERLTSCWLKHLATDHGWDEDTFVRALEDLQREGLIERHGGWDYRILFPEGVRFVEHQGLLPEAEIREKKEIRRKILAALAGAVDANGKNAALHYTKIFDAAGFVRHIPLVNLDVLKADGLIEWVATGTYRITIEGLSRHN